MVDYANIQRADHIITVEDPIEFVHRSQNCLVQHREVGVHTRSFPAALRGAFREDPGMIEVGKKKGNQPLDDAVIDHLHNGRISPEEAYDKAIDKKKFRQFLKEPPVDASEE